VIITVYFLFLILNSIKISIFNLYVMQERKPVTFCCKFIYTFVFMMFIFTGVFLNSRILFGVFYLLQLIYMNICISYYNFYYYFLHFPQSLKLIRETLDVVRHNSVPRNLNQLLAITDLPVFLWVFAFYDPSSLLEMRPYFVFGFLAGILVILFYELIHAARGQSLVQLFKTYPGSELQVVSNYGTLTNTIVDFSLFPNYRKITEQFEYGKPKNLKPKTKDRPNIIVIQAESLDSNAIQLCYQGKHVMPFLHALSEESIYYPYMLNYHKAGGTSDAEFSIMNSVEPLGNFPSVKIPLFKHENSFVKILSQNSYHTSVFHGNLGTYYQRNIAFPRMGFDTFYDITAMNLTEVGWGAPDHEVFQFVLEKMERQSSPFFYYLITMTNHCRFTNVLKYYQNHDFELIKNRDLRNFYNSLSYVDQTLKSFAKKVQSLGKESYIIILGDHTPGLQKKLYCEASLTAEKRHLEFVPLMIITPNGKAYRENTSVASFLDIAPTVLELANIETEFKTFGSSLLSLDFYNEPIPYRGYFFDRKNLYQMIKSAFN